MLQTSNEDPSTRRIHIEKLIVAAGLPANLTPSESLEQAEVLGHCIVCGAPGYQRFRWQSQIIKNPILCETCFPLWQEVTKHARS